MSTTAGRTWLRQWPWVVLPLLLGLLLAFYRYLDGAAQGVAEPFWNVFTKEMSGVAGTLLVLPLLVWLHRHRPPFTPPRVRNFALHLGAAAAYSLLHTSWNWGARSALYGLFGLGRFNYGHMPTRYLMELPMDLITYAIIGVVVWVTERYRANRARELQVARLQEQVQRSRLTQLQSQLRPHFLFNALNTVSSVMYDDVEKADDVVHALSGILRTMVASSDATVVPLSSEVELVRAFTRIQEARFGDRLRVRIEVPDALLDWPVPPLILQPIVENAIQHAMPHGPGPLEVRIDARDLGACLSLRVIDNGPGLNGSDPLTDDRHPGEGGVGLQNTQDRLKTQYGAASRMLLTPSASGGLAVTLEIPWTASAS